MRKTVAFGLGDLLVTGQANHLSNVARTLVRRSRTEVRATLPAAAHGLGLKIALCVEMIAANRLIR